MGHFTMNFRLQRKTFVSCKDVFRLQEARLRSVHSQTCCRRFEISPAPQPPRVFATRLFQSWQRERAVRPFTCLDARQREICKICVVPVRSYATEKHDSETRDKGSLVKARESPYAGLTASQKVKEAGKDVSYTLVIVLGLAVTGFMFYMIGRELLSSQSPSGVYGDALKKCQADIQVAAALGEPIKGYGETTRRGRRRHVSHTEFEVNGIPHMRMRFYIEGPYRKATVHVEVEKGESGKYEYRYLVVETEGYPHRTFILEDKRSTMHV